MEIDLNFTITKKVYNYSNKFMVSWQGTDPYFNNEQIKIDDIEMMTFEYGSSG